MSVSDSTAAYTADTWETEQSEPQSAKKVKQQSSSNELETYKKVKLLGKGAHGKAFLVKCGSDGVSKAIKLVMLFRVWP